MQVQTNEYRSNSIRRNDKPVNLYEVIRDAYNGTGGYLNGSYLVEHKRETDKDLKIRKEVTPYRNYFKPVVDALYKPCFDGTIKREFARRDQVLDQFIEDVDTRGTDIDTFARWTGKDTALYGCELVVLDNFSDVSDREIDNLADRKLPYAYTVRPDAVQAVFLSETGRFEAICYAEVKLDSAGEKTTYYRVWTTMQTYLAEDVVTTVDLLNSPKLVDGTLFDHNLGRVPCEFVYSESSGDAMILPPKFISAFMLNDAVYQIGSEIREYERKFVFPILTVQGRLSQERQERPIHSDTTDALPTEVNRPTYKVGADKILQYDADVSNPPQWLTVQVDGLRTMQDDMDKMVTELESWSGRGDADALSKSASAETRKLFFSITSADKVEFSQEMERFEQWLFGMLGLWVHAEFGYYGASIEYPKTFGVDDIFGEIQLFASQMELFADSPTVRAEILKRAVDTIFSTWGADERELLREMVGQDLANAVEQRLVMLNGDT